MIIPEAVPGREETKAPSDRNNSGMIGFGLRFTYVQNAMLSPADGRFVAIADVQKNRRESGKSLNDKLSGNSDCEIYRDHRELLARKDIEAVILATGDFWHTPTSILAPGAILLRSRPGRNCRV